MNRPFDFIQTTSPVKDFTNKILKLKYFYIALLVIFLTAAFLYNRYAVKVYEITSTIGPVDNDRQQLLASNDLFRGMGMYTPGRPIENDITNLMSFELVSSTISSLYQEIGYFKITKNLFKQVNELYNDSPFIIKLDKSHIQPVYTQFFIKILNDSTYRIIASQTDVELYNYIDKSIVSKHNVIKIDTVCRFNKTISNKYFKFLVENNSKSASSVKTNKKDLYYFEFYNLDYLTKEYLKKIIIGTLSPSASMINIKFSGKNLEKVIDFLNKYVELYIANNLEKKNEQSLSTINFIDSQISDVSDSLVHSEFKLRNYKSNNQVVDLSFQGQRIYQQMSDNENERNILELQSRYYSSVVSYLNTNTDMNVVLPPMSSEIEDPILNQLISDLIYLVDKRSDIINNKNEKSLFLDQVENKIANQKKAILEHATNNLNNLNISLNELNYRKNKLNVDLSKIPNTELNLVNVQRKFTLDNNIYTFLLQKRSEAAIAMASNHPDYELIEPAREITSVLKSPKTIMNFMMAIFFALMFPTSFLIIKDFLNDKISNPIFVERLISKTVIGIIPRNNHKTESVMIDFNRSSIAEAFRNIRSNLFFKMKSVSPKIIVLSSAQPQDGKSFVSYNLASAIASVGYKTLIIDGDMHRPTLHNKLKVENLIGLTDYMTNNSSIEGIIQPTTINNLQVITAGNALSNPAELLELGVLDEFFEILSNDYEYIIVDTPPAGVISESVIFMRYASEIILVCRNEKTSKVAFSSVIDNLNKYNFENIDVIFNEQGITDNPYKKYTNYYSNNKTTAKK
jgi:tyrosine-protein kinase Etk/Wzc